MPTSRGGRHENGQNFLTDTAVVSAIVALIDDTAGPIVEIGPGAGALTAPLSRLPRPLTAVEIDARYTQRLRRNLPHVNVVHRDFLDHRLPAQPHVVVGNLPFHLTTAILRKLLHTPHWTDAVLITQWEVARRRAGVGGATLMTAQWLPWYRFHLVRKVPAASFTPRPSVDAGLLTIVRRSPPSLPAELRRDYAAFAHGVFTGRGHGVAEILRRRVPPQRRNEVTRWIAAQRFRGTPLPRDLTAKQWIDAFERFGTQSP